MTASKQENHQKNTSDGRHEPLEMPISVVEIHWLHKHRQRSKDWFLQAPLKNTILLFMMLLIVISGAIVFMIMIGMVNIPNAETKAIWLEVNFQILTVIFTLATLVDQPKRCRGFLYSAYFLWDRAFCYFDQDFVLQEDLDKICAEFPWFHFGATAEPPTTTTPAGINRSDNRPRTLVDTIYNQRFPNWKAIPVWPLFFAMCLFNVSSIAQFVVSYTMFVYHPPESRPQLPILIALPIAFVTNFGGLGYLAYQQARSRRQHLSRDQEKALTAVDTCMQPEAHV